MTAHHDPIAAQLRARAGLFYLAARLARYDGLTMRARYLMRAGRYYLMSRTVGKISSARRGR